MVRIGGSTDRGAHIKESDYYTPQGEFRIDKEGSPTLLNCLMYKMCYYRFGSVYTEQGKLIHCGLVTLYGDIFGSTLAQVMACCLRAPSHYLNQCWLIISGLLQHAYQSNFIGCVREFNLQHELENYSLEFLPHHPGANELTWLSINMFYIKWLHFMIAQ